MKSIETDQSPAALIRRAILKTHSVSWRLAANIHEATNAIVFPTRHEDFILTETVRESNLAELHKKINKLTDQAGHGDYIEFLREVSGSAIYVMRYYPYGLPVQKYHSDPSAYLEHDYLTEPIDVVEKLAIFENDLSPQDHYCRYNSNPPTDKKTFYRKKALEFDSSVAIMLAYEPDTSNIISLCESYAFNPHSIISLTREIACVTHPNHRGKKISSTMTKDMTYILFDRGTVREIRIIPHVDNGNPDNDASSRLALGMSPTEENSPIKSITNIGFRDEPIYQILKK